MNKSELKNHLHAFQQKCADEDKPLTDLCVEEAFPGDASTSYIVQVKAAWADHMDCSAIIDFLFDRLWETTDERIREKGFFIQVIDSGDLVYCQSGKQSEAISEQVAVG